MSNVASATLSDPGIQQLHVSIMRLPDFARLSARVEAKFSPGFPSQCSTSSAMTKLASAPSTEAAELVTTSSFPPSAV